MMIISLFPILHGPHDCRNNGKKQEVIVQAQVIKETKLEYVIGLITEPVTQLEDLKQ
jgi:hypothetical protein